MPSGCITHMARIELPMQTMYENLTQQTKPHTMEIYRRERHMWIQRIRSDYKHLLECTPLSETCSIIPYLRNQDIHYWNFTNEGLNN